jgi:hypothetical protein
MLSFHAASITASRVRTEYPRNRGRRTFPREVRESEARTVRTTWIDTPPASCQLNSLRADMPGQGFASVPTPFGFIDRPLIKKSWPVHGYACRFPP